MSEKSKNKPKLNDMYLRYLTEYNKKHYKTFILKMRIGKDDDIIQKLSEQKSKNGYIRELIRKDIEANSTKGE